MKQRLVEHREGGHCAECGFPADRLYCIVPIKIDADTFYNQNGGLCAEDFLHNLCETKGEVIVEVPHDSR